MARDLASSAPNGARADAPDTAAGPPTDAWVADPGSGSVPTLGRWMGWRLRLLVGAALIGCLGLFGLARWAGGLPTLATQWRAGAAGGVEIAATDSPALMALTGARLTEMSVGAMRVPLPDALVLHRSGRWVVDDVERDRHRRLQENLGVLLQQPRVTLVFEGAGPITVAPQPRGVQGLPITFWLLGGVALVLYLIAAVVLVARPSGKNLLYAVMTLSQSGNLLFMAVESAVDLGLPAPLPHLGTVLRMGFDLATAAAVVNAICIYPKQLPGAGWIALGGWAFSAALLIAAGVDALPLLWWAVQGGVALLGLVAVMLMSWSYSLERHPFAVVLRRFGTVTIVTWLLLTGALAAVPATPGAQHHVSSVGSMIWYVFFGSLLVLVPFLSKSRQVMREFALLAAISTVATSLDLLFVAVFSLGQFASLTLSLFVSIAVYVGARQWILNQLLGTSMVTTERMFEQLYRIAREVEAHPQRLPQLMSQLLRELYEPLEVAVVDRALTAARASGDGSTLLVPVPALPGGEAGGAQTVALRFAQRGRRLFTRDDARFGDRVVEQLRRAVAFDKAVEQGRSEERARIAQDLHDDIGARLLTLMYKASSPEMEEYVRHTLKDLKTLTRGLAAPNHRLSHAAAEWKADLTQRLTAAHVELGWSFSADEDRMLTVVQWSALTRVLRELVSNTIAHAGATRVDISFQLERDAIELSVIDNGQGRNPRAWSHGLGLGGVRKRVKQLGGEVQWFEAEPSGIGCRVRIAELSSRP